MSEYRYSLTITGSTASEFRSAIESMREEEVIPNIFDIESFPPLNYGADGMWHLSLDTENQLPYGTVSCWAPAAHEAFFHALSLNTPGITITFTGENIDDPNNSVFSKAFHNGLYKEAYQEKQDIASILETTPWRKYDTPAREDKEVRTISLFERISTLCNEPDYQIAVDMIYLGNNIALDDPLPQETLYILASKLQEASGSWFSEPLLHEEYLDSIRYMAEFGLNGMYSPELPDLNYRDTLDLLVSADLPVFGTLVEAVAIQNQDRYRSLNPEQDISCVLSAIKAIQAQPQDKPDPERVAPAFSTMEETLLSAATELGWSHSEELSSDRQYIYFSQYSPAGEDFGFTVPKNNIEAGVCACAESFDVDEHVSMWLQAREHRVGGVPDAATLVGDAKAIQQMLDTLASALVEAREAFQATDRSPSLTHIIAAASEKAAAQKQAGKGRTPDR